MLSLTVTPAEKKGRIILETWHEDGKKFVAYTSEELRAKSARGETKSDWAKAAAMTEEEIQAAIAADPDDFEPTDEEFARARAQRGGKRPGAGRPKGSTKTDPKVQVSVRMSPQIATWLKEQHHQGQIIEDALRLAHNL